MMKHGWFALALPRRHPARGRIWRKSGRSRLATLECGDSSPLSFSTRAGASCFVQTKNAGCERHGGSRRLRTAPAASAVPLTHRDPKISSGQRTSILREVLSGKWFALREEEGLGKNKAATSRRTPKASSPLGCVVGEVVCRLGRRRSGKKKAATSRRTPKASSRLGCVVGEVVCRPEEEGRGKRKRRRVAALQRLETQTIRRGAAGGRSVTGTIFHLIFHFVFHLISAALCGKKEIK
jgi:hypothetical protein